ncbi:MAG: hypothetical protein R6V58_11650 [Planctomycetota bacterium]
MILRWLGLALLAFSWLLGLNYYQVPAPGAWWIVVAAGSLLLAGSLRGMPDRWTATVAGLLMIPALVVTPWPYAMALWLIVGGLAVQWLPVPERWRARLGSIGLVSGTVLLAQAVTLLGYASVTGRSHELPGPLAHLVGAVAGLLGMGGAVNDGSVALHSMRQIHQLAATWDLLAGPATVCFLAGGLVFLALRAWANAPPGRRIDAFWKRGLLLAAAVLLWLPVRVGLQMALYMHRVLRTEYEEPLFLARQFWHVGIHGMLLIGLVLLAWRLVRAAPAPAGGAVAAPDGRGGWLRWVSAGAVCAASFLLAVGLYWDPVGVRKEGRVIVDERHSDWESTERPYDTDWYGQKAGYNYACIYDYCSRYYEMSRLQEPLTDEVLEDCDVLMLKCPTQRYGPDEVRAVLRFVERGGGLMLVGEHTNVFNMGTNLNDVARRLGFEFRHDCLFSIPDPDDEPSVFEQRYDPPLVPHPIVRHMPPLDFAISASIAPGLSRGRAVILDTGLRNLPAFYRASNYYPQVKDRPDSRYGAFIELWAVRHGPGRVLAFGDSTIFSNFSTFEPGKAELMLGMIEWLNHRPVGPSPRVWMFPLGLACLVGGLVLARKRPDDWAVLLAAALLGWVLAVGAVRSAHASALPPPEPQRDYVKVCIDRTVCDCALSKSGFITAKERGFGIFARWILRVGYFTKRTEGDEALSGDLVVFLHPNKEPDEAFVRKLVRYVAEGGHVLVVDSPQNVYSGSESLDNLYRYSGSVSDAEQMMKEKKIESGSTANALLEPFGMRTGRRLTGGGRLTLPAGWPTIPVETACEVQGGRAWARLGGAPVGASTSYGKGSVTVVGFGERFTDPRMGYSGNVEPDDDLRRVFEVEFRLLRAIVAGDLAPR